MNRTEQLIQSFDELQIDAFYITHIPNIRYFSGFTGSSAYILITKEKNYFFTDFRYKEQSAKQVKNYEITIDFSPTEKIKELIKNCGLKSIAFESTRLNYNEYLQLQNNLPEVKFIPVKELIEKLTMVKTAEELETIKKACEITDKVFEKILTVIKPGVKEKDISDEITYLHMKFGAEKNSFDPIVASGWRGALPHGIASNKIIENGEMVTLDFGCVYNGFCSDLTRTISVGTPKDELKRIYDTVLQAQLMAIDAAKAGVLTNELDRIPRNFIDQSEFSGKFGHGLGHGLGIEVHEMPAVSYKTEISIPENTVITIEPGIYIEGLGGVRIEDDIILKQNGCDILNKSAKELIIL